MPKTLTMRLDEETHRTFVRAAKAERRSLANLVETAALRHIRENSFVDDSEMAEILSRPALVKRLKAGSRDARKRRGRFARALSCYNAARRRTIVREARKKHSVR